METLILAQRDVRDLLSPELAIGVVERAFAAHGRGESVLPATVDVSLPHLHGDFRAMPGYVDGAVGVKWVTSYPENPKRHGLPAVMAIYVLSDPSTAAPLAVMDATLLTAYRTGAAAAVASRHLAAEPKTLGIIGCGAQARQVVQAHRHIFPGIALRAADLSRQAAERLAGSFDGEAASLEEAAACDIVCTITPSRLPLVKRAWLAPRAHINAMGADGPGKQELDPQILIDARVFVDDVQQAVRLGEINVPVAKGLFDPAKIYATLGEVVAGRISTHGERGLTVFDATGLAIQDAALARAVYDAARDRGLGHKAQLVG